VKKHYIVILVTAVIILTSLMTISFVHATNWQTVTTVTGSGDKTSNNFTIQATQWRLVWSYTLDPQYPQYSVFYVFTYPQGENVSYVDYISANQTKTSGIEYIYQGQGNFYLNIIAANVPSYTITVQQDTDTTASPTPVPTASPTPVPTASPTPVPTASPTPVPTASPTPVPTASPTPVQKLNSSATNYVIPAAITFGVASPILVLSAFLLRRRKNKQKTAHNENKLENTPYDVFISYSKQDKNVANALCATLESRKIRCWIAPRDVRIGMDWPLAIIQALNSTRIFVLVFSSSSNKSNQTMREVERAVSKGMPIIPLRIENVEPTESMEYLLSTPHWLDAMTPPLEQHLQKLADTIQLLLASKEEHSDSNPPKN
jgi:hypothetical protein